MKKASYIKKHCKTYSISPFTIYLTKKESMRLIIAMVLLLITFTLTVFSQILETQLQELQQQLEQTRQQEKNIQAQIEQVKFQQIQRDLVAIGLPVKKGEELNLTTGPIWGGKYLSSYNR